MTISTEKVSRASQWTESTWSALVDHVADEFGLEKRGRSALRAKEIAKLIGAIPYLAGCDDPQDLAPANLRHYVASCGAFKKLYAATPENSAETLGRLAPLHYNGGDEAVIRRGMSLIALNMLADYKRDVELDRSLGKYNPIGAGDWDYDEKLCELLRNIDAVDCPDMDDIATVHTICGPWWNFMSFPDWS